MEVIKEKQKIKHIVFYSGGIGSWMTAKRVIELYGLENVILFFTDTLIEDADTYRFIDETVAFFKGVEYVRIADGRTPFEIFMWKRWLGNSRRAQCSEYLKQKTADKWIKANYQPDECVLYLGIDWTEEHRKDKPIEKWFPYEVRFPMCEEPYLSKEEMIAELKAIGIEEPRLYKLGFSHNNCSGMCVRGGQGHFINLLKTFPERFAMMEQFEKDMQVYLDADVTILSRTRNKIRENLSLQTLREEYEANEIEQLDLFDVGGCGCMVDY
jgi:hypothetical protein